MSSMKNESRQWWEYIKLCSPGWIAKKKSVRRTLRVQDKRK